MSQNELGETHLNGGLVFEASTVRRSRGVYERFVKRSVDVLLAGAVLIVLSPILAVTWIGLRLTLGPDVLLSQDRVGCDGRPFQMYKFRTMHHDRRATSLHFDGNDRRRTHKSADDPRHTRFGRFLRSVSLDETPQLLNVLRGQMSLVGPRPEMYHVAKKHGILDHPRHMVRPGLTGLFQTSGLRSKVDLSEGLHLDMAYVINLSFRTDLKILIRTLGALIRRTGV
ncbi:MAG: sugar transferase [Acidimicrobiia bacterium]|nr:sugar transferase [Acidimicrobiia bacterium]